MSAGFAIRYRQVAGDLYVQPSGVLDGSAACELVNLIADKYDGKGRVFIETCSLCDICPFGRDALRCRLILSRLPLARLFFTGAAGFAIAPEKCRVLACLESKELSRLAVRTRGLRGF